MEDPVRATSSLEPELHRPRLTTTRDSGLLPFSYPGILGEDVAGTVEEVGEGVTRFHKGQRVMAYVLSPPLQPPTRSTTRSYCHSIATKDPANGAFQLYSKVPDILAAPLPDALTFERAAVLPLALSTAAAGLFESTTLGLPLPPADGTAAPKGNATLLVWGAASSVGTAAVQLARASGLRVVATASARNHQLVRSLGAETVVDYTAPSVIQDIIAAVSGVGGDLVGVFDAVSHGETIKTIGKVLDAFGPTKVAMVLFPPETLPENYKAVHSEELSS